MEDLELDKIEFNPKVLGSYFENNVREMCKSCKRYNISSSCPPHIETIEYYKELLPTYCNGVLFIKKFIINDIRNWQELGRNSSEELRIEMKPFIDGCIYEGCDEYDYYGAGSCKNCIKCSYPCKFPNKQLIPIEGTGINVIKLVKDLANIDIKFPVENYGYFYRVGLILWD